MDSQTPQGQGLDQLYRIIDKLDQAIVKLADVSSDIKQILAVHENRLDQNEIFMERSFVQLDAVHSRVSSLRDDMNKESMMIMKEVNKINEWRWQMVGASSVIASVVAVIVSQLPIM